MPSSGQVVEPVRRHRRGCRRSGRRRRRSRRRARAGTSSRLDLADAVEPAQLRPAGGGRLERDTEQAVDERRRFVAVAVQLVEGLDQVVPDEVDASGERGALELADGVEGPRLEGRGRRHGCRRSASHGARIIAGRGSSRSGSQGDRLRSGHERRVGVRPGTSGGAAAGAGPAGWSGRRTRRRSTTPRRRSRRRCARRSAARRCASWCATATASSSRSATARAPQPRRDGAAGAAGRDRGGRRRTRRSRSRSRRARTAATRRRSSRRCWAARCWRASRSSTTTRATTRRWSTSARHGDGVPLELNRVWVDADVRITTGFVEPHFFAGFSGGPKMVAPGLAGLRDGDDAARRARASATRRATWG